MKIALTDPLSLAPTWAIHTCSIVTSFFVKAAVASKGEMDVYKYVIHVDHIEVILCVPRSARLASKSCPPQ